MSAWEDLPLQERIKLSVQVAAVYGARELLVTLPYVLGGLAIVIPGAYALMHGVSQPIVLGVTAVTVGPAWYWLERTGKRANFDNRIRTWFDQVIYLDN